MTKPGHHIRKCWHRLLVALGIRKRNILTIPVDLTTGTVFYSVNGKFDPPEGYVWLGDDQA